MKKRKRIYISIIYIVAIALVCSFEYWLLLEKHYLFSNFIFPLIVHLACILLACILIAFKKKFKIVLNFFFKLSYRDTFRILFIGNNLGSAFILYVLFNYCFYLFYRFLRM